MVNVTATTQPSYTLLAITKNGDPVSPQNSVDEVQELAGLDFDIAAGPGLAVLSGMPTSFVGAAIAHYKNQFGAIAVANPRLGVALVIHSTSPDYRLGDSIPL
jgi:hypothetical protein